MENNKIFCDWIIVRQKHEPHEPFSSGIKTVTDPDTGEVLQRSHIFKSVKGENGSNAEISSDGETVTFSANPSRWNRSENYQGEALDEAKQTVNQILQSQGLPPFTDGEKIKLLKGESIETGAVISRLDMTTNLKTGSPRKREAWLRHRKTMEYPRLAQTIRSDNRNIYYGKASDSKTILIYDKALHLRQVVLPNTEELEYIKKLAEWCDQEGTVRIEIRYGRALRQNNLRLWRNATSEKLEKQFSKDLKYMTKKVEAPDWGELATKRNKGLIQTLCMYIAGVNIRDVISDNTFYKHRAELLKYGYDISNQNVHLLQPKVQIITLEPAGVPDFYRHAVPLKPLREIENA